MIEPVEMLAARVRAASVVRLNDPAREEILAEIQGRTPKTNRLNNVAEATVVDGIRFPSGKQARRYAELKLAERAGQIIGLQIEVTIPLVVNGVSIFPKGYRADATYVENIQDPWGSWKFCIEDSKGMRTELYEVKCKLIKAIYGITIKET